MPYGPGPGFAQPYPAFPPAYGPGPEVAGAYAPQGMPFGPNQPFPAVQGAMDDKDCGCGGPQLVGSYGPQPQIPAGYGMPGGFAPNYGAVPTGYRMETSMGYEAEGEYPEAGGYGSGVAPVYAPPYGQPFASPPFMNPYGPMGAGFGMARKPNESDGSDD